MRKATLTSAFVLLLAGASAAQDLRWTLGSPTAGLPGDGDVRSRYELDDVPELQVREVDESSVALARLRRGSTARLEGFDTSRHAVASVEAFFDREQGPEDERSTFQSSATLRLVLRTRTADGSVRWWRLSGDSERLNIVDEPIDPARSSEPGFEDDRGDRLVPATGDPRLPIVDVQYTSTELHASSSSVTRHHLLLDFRLREPRIIGVFDETEGGCGGACTVYGCIFGVGSEVGCRWDYEHETFLCASTLRRRDTAWLEKRATLYFHFGGEAKVEPPTATWPSGLDPSMAKDLIPGDGDAKFVKGYGTVSAIGQFSIGKTGVVLAGAPSLSWHFGARLFAAVTAYPYRGPFVEIGSRLDVRHQEFAEGGAVHQRLENRDYMSAAELDGLTPDGPPPQFVSTVLSRSDTLTVLRVLVTEGRAKGVYLVGLELVGDRLVTDAMLVATNGSSHLDCNTWRVPATAVAMTVTPTPFAASLDVESGWIRGDGEDPPQEPPCRERAVVGWEPGAGFRHVSRAKRCDTARRAVAIDDDGRIGVATPAARPRP